MSRTERLFNLLQLLRRHRYPVSGEFLARELDVSLRSIYRDIMTLQAQGAHIEGERGIGYILRPGFILPPLMFSEDEIEAIVLGSRWVANRGDAELQRAAQNALSKISAVLPSKLREQLEASGLLIAPGQVTQGKDDDLVLIRKAIRLEKKLILKYEDIRQNKSHRVIWPLAIGYFDEVRILIAWCEKRTDFRHFRTDRITQLELQDQPIPQRRQALLKKWRQAHNIPQPS